MTPTKPRDWQPEEHFRSKIDTRAGKNHTGIFHKSPTYINWARFENLAHLSAKGGLAIFSGSWMKFALQLATTIILARVLGPDEYGVAAIIVVFAGVAELIRDSGLTTLIIQRRMISSSVVSSLNAVNLVIGAVAGAALCLSGPGLSALFADQRYESFVVYISLMFIFASAAAVPSALLARNLEFRRLAVIDVVSVALSCTIGISTAVSGWGALSLVLQTVSFSVIQSCMSIAWCPWRPGSRFAKRRELKRYLLHFSSISLVKILNYMTGKVDNLIVGLSVGTRAAGLYNQAYQLMLLPLTLVNGPVQRVFVPAMSRLVFESDPMRARACFRGTISVVAYLLWPTYAVLAVFSKDIVVALFGGEWIESASIFSILVIAGIAQSLAYLNTSLFFASGLAKRNTIWTIISRPIMIGSFFLGIQWGVTGLAIALVAVSALEIGPGYVLARGRAQLRWSDLVVPLFWPSAIGLVAVALSVLVQVIWPIHGNTATLIVDLLLVGVVTIGLALMIRPVRLQVLELAVRLKR